MIRNTDVVASEMAQRATALMASIKDAENDEKKIEEAFAAFGVALSESIAQEARTGQMDSQILSGRNVRQLTSEETEFYQKTIDAMRSPNPQQAFAGMDVVMPKTTIDEIFDDLVLDHPLLDVIDFQNATAVTEWLMNTHDNSQLATWSELCAEIVKEITSGFKKVNLEQNKLSAFIPICKAMLDLGPVWMDRYVRAILSEALYCGLENGIINGRGQTANLHEPIGMRKDLSAAVDPNTGYADKTAVPVTSFDPAAYGALMAQLSKSAKGNPRKIGTPILVVNPTDNLTKIMPATTIMTPMGGYVNNVLPVPTTIVESVFVAEGEAILGLPDRYFMAAGAGKSGKIEYSDEYRFLEDQRVYITKFYGHGQPKDNGSFLLLDISGLEPLAYSVKGLPVA